MKITKKGNDAMFAFISGSIFSGVVLAMLIWGLISRFGLPESWRMVLAVIVWLIASMFIGSLAAGGVVEDEEKEKVRRMLNEQRFHSE